jgi:hypothetical protein
MTRTFKMDDAGQIYLTAIISVMEANSNADIAGIVLKTLNMAPSNSVTEAQDEDDESEDEVEIGGTEAMRNLTHFYNVLNNKPNHP